MATRDSGMRMGVGKGRMAGLRAGLLGGVMATLLVLAGCSSVSLDSAPVEDRSTGSGMVQNASSGDTAASTVTQAQVTTSDDAYNSRGVVAPQDSTPRVVYFDYDSYTIKPEFQAVIEANAKFIMAHRTAKVVIEGHTDERGGSEYNLALGQRRSEVVRHALTLLGVPDAQLEAISFGEEKPAMQGNDEAAWAKNRRAEISYR